MTTWCRVTTDTICGGPHLEQYTIPKGEAAQLIEVRGLSRKLVRCERCAGASAPAEVPRPRIIEPSRPKLVFGSSMQDLAADWKAKQAKA